MWSEKNAAKDSKNRNTILKALTVTHLTITVNVDIH